MVPIPVPPGGRRRLVAAALAVLAIVGACGASTTVASFDPSSACTTDGRFAGAYPQLEALLPTTFEGASPASVDSGRNCTPASLGTLAADGVSGVRFAGATFALGGTTGVTVAVFEGDGLDATKLMTFYEDGARKARRTEKLQVADATVGGRAGRRLDVLGSDGSGQTIVTWPAAETGRVNVLLASDLGDTRVADALRVLGSR